MMLPHSQQYRPGNDRNRSSSRTAGSSQKQQVQQQRRSPFLSSNRTFLAFGAIIGVALLFIIASNLTHMRLMHNAGHRLLHAKSLLHHGGGSSTSEEEVTLMSPQSQAMQFSLEYNMKQTQQELVRVRDELESERDRVRELEAKLEEAQSGTGDDAGGPKRPDSSVQLALAISNEHASSFCSLLSSSSLLSASALHTWNSNLDAVLQASQHENDRQQWRLKDFTAQLLHLVSASGRLEHSILSIPKLLQQWEAVDHIMQLAFERFEYFRRKRINGSVAQRRGKKRSNNDEGSDDDPDAPRKIKILIMGGSLVVGVNCRKIVSEHSIGIQMPNRLCTWTHRLETLLNGLASSALASVTQQQQGNDDNTDSDLSLVEVHKIALGGTNTQTGSVLWENDFLPEEMKRPDIVINAYATNDMHILTVLEAQSKNQTLRDKVLDMTESFIRAVLTPEHPDDDTTDDACQTTSQPPLLLHIDDYLGNEQREILTTMELSQAVSVLAQYYGIASMSYANVVRDWVYGDTKESWFSPKGWWENGEMLREIHPGMGMHIVASWVTAYNLLHMTLTRCQLQSTTKHELLSSSHEYYPFAGLPTDATSGKWQIPGKPKELPHYALPPELTPELSLESISEEWRTRDSDEAKLVAALPSRPSKGSSKTDCKASTPKSIQAKCPFTWFSGISHIGRNATFTKDYFTRHAPSTDQVWDLDAEKEDKLGMIPTTSRKQMIIEVLEPKVPVRAVTIFYMKSYGTKWEGSRIRLSVERRLVDGTSWETVRVASASESSATGGGSTTTTSKASEQRQSIVELVGLHDKKTSETYTHKMVLGEASKTDLRVVLELIGGTTFKLMGLAICK